MKPKLKKTYGLPLHIEAPLIATARYFEMIKHPIKRESIIKVLNRLEEKTI